MSDRDHGYEREVAEPWICCRFCTVVFQATGQGVVRVLHHEISQHRKQCEQNQQSNYYRIFQLQELRVDARPESPLRGFAFELSAKDYESSTTTVATPSPSAPLFPPQARIWGDTTCSICSKYFIDSRNLQKHMTLHKGQGSSSCKFCSRQFRHPDLLERHMAECHDKEAPFSCSHCKAKFKSREKSNDHVRQIHSESPTKKVTKKVDRGYAPVDCSLCGLTLFHKRNLLRHHRNSHPEVELPKQRPETVANRPKEGSAPCPICGTSFPASEVVAHAASHQCKCQICGRDDIPVAQLAEHGVTHVGESLKCPDPTEECKYVAPRRLRSWEHWNRHHLKIRPVMCLTCGETFASTDNQRKHHVRVHLGITQNRTYPCRMRCGRRFQTRSKARLHEAFGHRKAAGTGDVNSNSNADKIWRSKRERDRIRKREARSRAAAGRGEGVPPPPGAILSVNGCVLCGRDLSSRRSLVRHLFLVHGVTPKPKLESQNATTAPHPPAPREAGPRLHPMSSADEEAHHNPAAGEILPIASIYDQWEEPMATNKNPSEPLLPSERPHRSTSSKRKRVRPIFVLKSHGGSGAVDKGTRRTPSACGICRRVLSSERNVKRHLIEVHKLPIEEAIAMPTIPRPEAQLSKSLRAAAAPMASSPSKKKMKKIRKEGSRFRGRVVPVTCQLCGRVLSHARSHHRHQVLVHGLLTGDWRRFYKQCGRTVPRMAAEVPQSMEEGPQATGGEGDFEQPTINVKIEALETVKVEIAEGGAAESIGGDWPHEEGPPELQQEIPEAERLLQIVKIEGGVDESNREEPEAPLPLDVMGSNGVLLLKVEID